jgi:hypothetical protein
MTTKAIEDAIRRALRDHLGGTDIIGCTVIYYRVIKEEKKPYKKNVLVELQLRIKTIESE